MNEFSTLSSGPPMGNREKRGESERGKDKKDEWMG
jgi:hypothetical protein